MPDWANKLWFKAVSTFVAIFVTSICTGFVIAVNFYYETRHDIAILKDQIHGVLVAQDTRITKTEVKSTQHDSQLAQVVKKQNEFAKEIMPSDSVDKSK